MGRNLIVSLIDCLLTYTWWMMVEGGGAFDPDPICHLNSTLRFCHRTKNVLNYPICNDYLSSPRSKCVPPHAITFYSEVCLSLMQTALKQSIRQESLFCLSVLDTN
jgi:hypothetical protein